MTEKVTILISEETRTRINNLRNKKFNSSPVVPESQEQVLQVLLNLAESDLSEK